VALIELDLDAPPVRRSGRPPIPPRSIRLGALLAASLLALALGGSAPSATTVWRHLGRVPMAGASTWFQLVGGAVYAIDGNANRRTVTAWAVRPPRRLWAVSTPLKLDPSGTVIQDAPPVVMPAGAVTVLRYGDETIVLDAATGQVRWRTDVPLLAYRDGVGVTQETRFAPGTEYDQASGKPGELFFSADGVPHTQPPITTVLHGLDLATGTELWTITEPGALSVAPGAEKAPGFVVITSGRLTLRAATTGAVIQERALPRRTIAYPEVVGALLILRYARSIGEAAHSSAYALAGLAHRWDRDVDEAEFADCVDLPCVAHDGAQIVLDPRTGAERWRISQPVALRATGFDVLRYNGVYDQPLEVRDGRTGTRKVDLSGWLTTLLITGDGKLVLNRQIPGRPGTAFGVLQPGSIRVRSLGVSGTVVQDCQADPAYVACRVGDGVDIWAYRG
jgi:outer membrane protein assembly factor BamB